MEVIRDEPARSVGVLEEAGDTGFMEWGLQDEVGQEEAGPELRAIRQARLIVSWSISGNIRKGSKRP